MMDSSPTNLILYWMLQDRYRPHNDSDSDIEGSTITDTITE